ncbi:MULTISPECIES: hypothetical protein, partial [unclassified Kitasatospora]|uniref:hypothetical protein n=1 Tax=unclassified Kitasatospora TaxID=2633591 RepID=UPI0033E04A8B
MITTVGAQLVELFPLPVEVKAVLELLSDCAAEALLSPGVAVTVPFVFVAAPDQYETFMVVIVSADVPPPVVKLVADTVAVHVLVASPRP